MSPSLRSRIEHASAPVVQRIDGLPRVVPFLAILALMAFGVFVPHVGFVATALVAALVLWMLLLTWPRLSPPEKLLRVAVLFLVVAVAVVQGLPRA